MKIKDIHFLINTSEITAGTRGASLGPDAIIAAARKQNDYLFGQYPIHRIPDENHQLDVQTDHQYAKHIDGLLKVFEYVRGNIKSIYEQNGFPLILAADHGSAGGTIAGIKSAFPDKRLGVVWIDAHADLHSPYTTPSGNIHGMPLSTALNEDNLPCKSNNVPQETVKLWNALKNIGDIAPKISPQDLVFVGVRDTESQEDALMGRLQIKNHTVEEVNSKGEKNIVSEILKQLSDCDLIYISFDVDSMDPNITSHGTGTPVDNGLTPIQAQNIILGLLESPKVNCLEIVEVNPCLDEKTNTMAETTFQILKALVKK